MKLARLTLAAIVTALLSFTLASPSPALDLMDLVRKSEAAEKNVSYRGIKYADIIVGSRTIRAKFKVVHRKPDETRVDYFTPSELMGIITIDHGSDSWRYIPAQQQWKHNKWEFSPQHSGLALDNYRLLDGGRGTVAGRSAYILQFKPKKSGNPGETIWIDSHCFLVLKSELRNSKGTPISVSAFEQLIIDPSDITDAAFKVPSGVKRPDNPVPQLGFDVIRPKYMPKGYSYVQTSIVPIGKLYAGHLMYTNGINTISIFERKKSSDDSGDWKSALGNVANVLRFDRNGITFTIIGDIDKRELRRIADSIK